MSENHPRHFATEIFTTLVEIQEILYATDQHRNRASILRLQNICFKHAMLLKIHLQGCLKSLTSRKLFGSYYHSLIIHAPQQYRLVSGRTSNTESEEATFNAIKITTNLTSNHHPPNVIVNALIRLQAKDQLNENQLTPEKESKLNDMYSRIKQQLKNTMIGFDWVKKYRRQYQCLLKSQADYLTDQGKWWRESREGIEFFDLNESPNNSKLLLSHFRSSNIKRELAKVNNCWLEALQNRDKVIPAYSIDIDSGENDTQPILLTTLDHFKNGPQKITDPDTNLKNTSTHNLSIPTLATSNAVATNSSTLQNTSNVSLLQSPEVHKVSQICSPPQNIDFFCDNRRTQLPVHPDTPNAKKPSHVTSTPLTKSKKNEEVLLFVQKFPLDNSKQVLYSKSSAKLIKLFGEKEFIKSFDKARKKAKSCNSVANIKEYKAELATIKVKISNLRCLIKEKLKTMEREILMTSDDINLQPTKIHEKEYNDIIKTLQYIEILWKELEL